VVRDLVRSYYAQIRSLLRERPDLRRCIKRCKHCGILFFTHPRNAGRDDLRCGFGCREAHRRTSSTRRSVEFHRGHPVKKRALNQRRYLLSARASSPSPPAPEPSAFAKATADKSARCMTGPAAGAAAKTPLPILKHVRLIVSLIEGRLVGLKEIVLLLAKKGRQRSIARSRRRPYGVRRVRDRGS